MKEQCDYVVENGYEATYTGRSANEDEAIQSIFIHEVGDGSTCKGMGEGAILTVVHIHLHVVV